MLVAKPEPIAIASNILTTSRDSNPAQTCVGKFVIIVTDRCMSEVRGRVYTVIGYKGT